MQAIATWKLRKWEQDTRHACTTAAESGGIKKQQRAIFFSKTKKIRRSDKTGRINMEVFSIHIGR